MRIILVFCVFLIARCLNAADVLITWNANTETDLAGYKVYYGGSSKNYGVVLDVGNVTEKLITGFEPGTYYFAATAYDFDQNQSDFSNEFALTITNGTPPEVTTFTVGETAILTEADNGNGDLLVAQPVILSQAGMLQSLSFYVTTTGGQLRLGIYDATGSGGTPGQKLAETAAFIPVSGWNLATVATPVPLAVGNYWIAYLPQSNALGFVKKSDGLSGRYYTYNFGGMPQTFSTIPNFTQSHWSFYATLSSSVIPPPAPTISLSASHISIQSGQSSTLSWTTTNATSVAINQGIGVVATTGTRSVSPTATTTYTATATGGGGTTTTANATVTVTAIPQPSGPLITLTAPANRQLRLTRRSGNSSLLLPITINKNDCLTYNGQKVPGGLNCQ